MPTEYHIDDRVINTARPEWGSGVVVRARAQTQGGVRCQMLSVRFDRAGMKQLSTAMAPLRAADATGARPAETVSKTASETMSETGDSPPARSQSLPQLTASGLSQLPPEVMDSSRSANQRLAATLAQFKFIDSRTSEALAPTAPRSARPPPPDQRLVLNWAISRSGVSDPLSQLNRTELEAAYDAFARRLHDQLRPLIKAAAGESLTEFARVVEAAPPAGRDAARRALPAGNTSR